MLQGPPSSATGWAGLGSGAGHGLGGRTRARGDTRGCAQAGWRRSFPVQPPGGIPGTGRGQDTAGHCSHAVPGNAAGTRACPWPWASGSRRTPGGQPPAQPAPAPGTAEPRRCVTAGKGHGGQGQGPARQRQWQGPKSFAVPEGVVPGDGAAGCHPCAVRAQGCPLRGHRAGCAHACARGHARTALCAPAQTRGAPAGSVPAGFPNSWLDAAPLQPPPAPCPDLCTNPPGRPWGGYKEGARGCPRVTEPGTGEWGHPWRGLCWEGDGVSRDPRAPPAAPHRALRSLPSHEGVAAVPARLHGRPGGGSKGRLTRGAEGAGAEGAGAGPESHGHGQGRLQQGAGVGGGSAGQAVAVGQRGAGEAAAAVAQGAAGGALEEDSGRVASPGAARGLSGLGTPGSHPLSWCSQ